CYERVDRRQGVAAPGPPQQRLDRRLELAGAGTELAERLPPGRDLGMVHQVGQRIVLTDALLDLAQEQRRLLQAATIVDVPADHLSPAVAGELIEDLGMDLIDEPTHRPQLSLRRNVTSRHV